MLTLDFPPTRGGIQSMARETLARVQRTAFRVVAPADVGFEQVDAALGLPVRRVRPMVGLGRRGFIPAIARASWAEARAQEPDVALAMHVLAAPGALAAGAPTVVVCHGGELRSTKIRPIARLVLPRAERVIAVSRFTRSEAIALGADPMKVSVLQVGAPDPIAVPKAEVDALRKALGGGRIVLSVARLAPHKGHDRLINAVAALPEDVRLVVVGDGTARTGLQEQVRAAGLQNRVSFSGLVSDEQLPRYFAAADCFALLSRETSGPQGGFEGGGIALVEAAAYGLPIVAGATGGIPETIRDGETGLLVDPEDQRAVRRALARLLDDRALAKRLGDAARTMAVQERSWTVFVARLEAVLELAARRSGEVLT